MEVWGEHWRHLANTIAPFMFGDDAALSNYFEHLLLLLHCSVKILTGKPFYP